MTHEEVFCFVLNKIKRASEFGKSNEPINYGATKVVGGGAPSTLEEIGALEKLEEKRVIKIVERGSREYYRQFLVEKISPVFEARIAKCPSPIRNKNYSESPNRFIMKNPNGNYLCDGKRIEMGQKTIYYKIFDILYTYGDQDSSVSYEDIERELLKSGFPESKNEKARNKRIHNAILNEQQGLFRFAKVNGKRFRNQALDQKKLVEYIRGKGLKLNNPIL